MPQLLKDIEADLIKFGKNPKEYPRLGIVGVESKPWVGTKSLMFSATAKGETDAYPVLLQFFGMEFDKEKSKKLSVPVKVEKALWYHNVPSFKSNSVSLKCGCYDFRFRYEYPLHKNGALIGNFRKYEPVPGSNRPPANPLELMGFCKHLSSFIKALKDAKLAKA